MPLTLRVAGVAVALLTAGVSPAAAQSVAPSAPTLAGTDLSSPAATVAVARCSRSFGFAAFSAIGTAVNGAYSGPFREDATAQLGAGSLSPDLEYRSVLAAGHRFSIESPLGQLPPFQVFGTQRAIDQVDAAFCAKPFSETTSLYLSYFPNTRYAARIEMEGRVYVDRGEGFVQVDITETNGERTARTQTILDSSSEEVAQLLRRRDCRRGRFAELAYSSKSECRADADANQDAD
jgi:hypothetical protein